jgi:hypothetical protein
VIFGQVIGLDQLPQRKGKFKANFTFLARWANLAKFA